MKKLFSLMVLMLLVFTVACTQADDDAKDKNDNKQEEKADKGNTIDVEKKALVTFEMQLVDIMHKNGSALADLADAKGKYADPDLDAAEKPTKEDLEALKAEAQKSSKEIATATSALTIPTDLSEENQATLKTAVENFVKGMEWNAENIPALPTEAATEGETAIAEFDKGINDLHKKLELIPVERLSDELY